ncbi:MAG: F0F1 ATP synthase subunit A [Acidithiobacillus sp.]|nr:F0F1 ATP synthase subunit A [Acidithiobacillus sp.]
MASSDIAHHLTNWTVGQGFWTFDVDTILMGIIMAALLVGTAMLVGRRLEAGAPHGMQAWLEGAVEFIDKLVTDSFPVRDPLIAPVALTVFLWILLMNSMDLIPAYLPGVVAAWFGLEHFRVTPTVNLNTTFAVAIVVFLLTLFTSLRVKGFAYFHTYLVHPFGKYLFPVNIVMTAIEEITKPLSLALRLFGNMFAGELVFLLLALLPWWGNIVLGVVWSGFESLIVMLQAFIFTVLTVVYLGMANMQDH